MQAKLACLFVSIMMLKRPDAGEKLFWQNFYGFSGNTGNMQHLKDMGGILLKEITICSTFSGQFQIIFFRLVICLKDRFELTAPLREKTALPLYIAIGTGCRNAVSF